MKKYRKSFFGATAIVVMVAIFLFVIAIVLSFFYFFKFRITLVMVEQYRWNKFQEVPLSLLSTDIDNEPFVSRVNKVYYRFEDGEQLKNRIDEILKRQISPTGTTSASVDIRIAGIKITGKIPCTLTIPGCEIEKEPVGDEFGSVSCWCSSGCPGGRREIVSRTNSCDAYTVCDCMPETQRTVFSAKFPFPLTFNGTDKFVENISYDAILTG